mgnify:CR=1 FL=1
MKTLLVLRHAKSSWSNDYLADHERPLNDRGKQDAPRMGRLLQTEDLVPDLIISSSAERALNTAEMVALNCDYDHKIAISRRFYHADPDDYLEVLAGLDDAYERVMIVGHNPGMEELVEDLTGEPVRMATAALAYLQVEVDSWREFTFETPVKLAGFWLPKEL